MKKISLALALVAALPGISSTAQADSVSHASAASVIVGASVPVAVVSGVVIGVAGASSAIGWSLTMLSQELSAWKVDSLTPQGDKTAVTLQEAKGPQRVTVTMATQTVETKQIKAGQTVQIVKKSNEVAVLQTTEGKPLAVLSDGAAANQHSTPRGPR